MKIMDGSMDLPVEILVKIFNFLPNHDIRCGVSLTCKIFQKICQDESLVPVKDLCIHGDKQLSYDLRDFEDVSDIIVRSKSLTSLKIKVLNLETAKRLVHIALQACPKLINLEIVEASEMPPSDADDFFDLLDNIGEFGNGLHGIVLLLNDYYGHDIVDALVDSIKSPELKTLTLGSHSLGMGGIDLYITPLVDLSKRCKKLEDLKIIKAYLSPNEDEIKKRFPNCKVELKECKFLCERCYRYEFDDAHHYCQNSNGIEKYFLCFKAFMLTFFMLFWLNILFFTE